MDATGDSIELVRRDSDERKKAPSGGAVAHVRIDVEEAKTDSEEPRGSLAGHVRVQQKDGSSRIEGDGAEDRANRDRDIYWHIWEDEQQAVKRLLQQSKNKDRQVKMKDSHGYAPVHYAAKFNRPEIMQILINSGADIRAKTVSEEYTPLHLAACYLRHACKPCKSTEITVQLDVFDQTDSAERRYYERTQSDTGTLELPKRKYRRSSSVPATFERQTSCKQIFDLLVTDCTDIDVNATDRYGFTALHIACQSGNKEAVESLLAHKDINLTVRDGNGDTPLHEACFHGHKEVVEVLLEKMTTDGKPDVTKVNIKNKAGLTPFHIACREDHYRIVQLLLDAHPCLLKECDNDKATPLHYACRNDSIDTVRLMEKSSSLYEFLTPKTSDGVTPIHVAAQYGCVKVMEKFLEKECEVVDVKDTYDQTPLHYATEYGKIDMMALLIESGANKEVKDVHSYTPLLTAAEYGQVEGFELLLKKGAKLVDKSKDPPVVVKSKDRKTALFLAAEHNHHKIIKLILTKGSDSASMLYQTTDTSFNTCLHIAAQNGHLECVKVLWNHRANLGLKLQTKNALLKTAMHLAAENGHNHIVTELQHYWEDSVKDKGQHETIDVGRLLKSVDDDGNTPLHLACKHGFLDVAKTLIKMPGANIGARNKVLWTPLDCASANGHARIVKELVSAKAEIDPTDKLKTTPLHLAAKEGHVTAVETLIKHGANLGLRDQRGFNALDWAIEKGHRDVAEAIISSSKWKLALRNCTKTQDGRETTPFRKLIQRMPDVAQLVLKKCTSTNAKDGSEGTSPDSKDYAVTFSYEFIEDAEDAKEWKAQHKIASVDEKSSQPVEGKSYKVVHFFRHRQKRQKMKHPLRIMVESKRTELLKHPLIYSLIDHKWKHEMVMLFFYISLVCYLLFAVLLTAFALQLPNPLSPTCDFSPHHDGAVNISQLPSSAHEAVMKFLIDQNITLEADGIFSQGDVCNDTTLAVDISEILCGSRIECPVQSKFLVVAPWFLIAFCLIRVFRKIWKCRLLHRFNYRHIGEYIDDIDLATLVKIPLIICTIIFISGIHGNKCLCPHEWEWQVGIVAVFLSWADVVLYMRKLRLLDTGLYVLMFQSIFKTFVRAVILTIVLVVMFALAFHMTFNHFHSFFERSPFNNMLQSTWKIMTMTTGEMGYEDIFHQASGGSDNDIPPIPFPEVSYILWVIFLILMPILFTNLLVGLAVDDIKGIQEAATLKRLEMRVDLILALDGSMLFHGMQKLIFKLPVGSRRFLGNCQNLYEHRELTIHPNRLSFYFFVPKFLVGENYSSAEHLSMELNPTKTPADQMTQNLMLEISKIQEMLLSMNEGVHEVKERVRELSEEKVKEQVRSTIPLAPSAPGPGWRPMIVTPT